MFKRTLLICLLIMGALFAGCVPSPQPTTVPAPTDTVRPTATAQPLSVTPSPTYTPVPSPTPTFTPQAPEPTLLPPTLSGGAPSDGVPLVLFGTLIDGTGGPPISDAALVIQDGVITAVGPRSEVMLPLARRSSKCREPRYCPASSIRTSITLTKAQICELGHKRV